MIGEWYYCSGPIPLGSREPPKTRRTLPLFVRRGAPFPDPKTLPVSWIYARDWGLITLSVAVRATSDRRETRAAFRLSGPKRF